MYFSRVRVRPEIFRNTQMARVLADNSYTPHRLLWDLFPGERKRCFLFREEIAREQLGLRGGVRGEPVYYLVSSVKPGAAGSNPIFTIESKEYRPRLKQGDTLCFELRANPVVTKSGKKHDVVMDAQRSLLEGLCEELGLQDSGPDSSKKSVLKKRLLAHGGEALDARLTSLLNEDTRYADILRHGMAKRDKLDWSLKAVVDRALLRWIERQGKQHGFVLRQERQGLPKLQNSSYRWHELNKKGVKGMKSGFSSIDFTGELQVTDTLKFSKALFSGIGRSRAFGCGLMMVKRCD